MQTSIFFVGAVPSKMPGCSYLSSEKNLQRESPDVRKERLERCLRDAIAKSVQDHEKNIHRISFASLEELKTKIEDCAVHSDWIVVKRERMQYTLFYSWKILYQKLRAVQ